MKAENYETILRASLIAPDGTVIPRQTDDGIETALPALIALACDHGASLDAIEVADAIRDTARLIAERDEWRRMARGYQAAIRKLVGTVAYKVAPV